ncbi:hypothetical protein KJZ63_00755 [Patescibacteria group bacterium]|nr:hypothetical protein [Patescibacteria group bacterium]
MGNEVLIVVIVIVVILLIGKVLMEKLFSSPAVKRDHDETIAPHIHQQHQFEDDLYDGMGLRHRYPRH